MSKPTPTFSFGNPSGTSFFGQTPASSQGSSNPTPTATSNLFGGSSNQPASSGGLFGSSTTTAGAQKPLTFGSNSGSGASTPTLFGASTGNASGGVTGGLFGGGGTPAASSPFGGGSFTFGKKPEENKDTSTSANGNTPAKIDTPAQTQPGNTFGAAGGPSIFGSTAPASSAPAGSTTPATTKPGGLFSFANSTTPAGAPPSDNNSAAKPAGMGLFGAAQPASGGLFGAQKPADSGSKPATPSLFGGTAPSGTTSNLFGAQPPKAGAPASGSNLFGNLNTTKPDGQNNTPNASAPTSTAPKPSFSFPSASTATTAQPTSSSTATAGTPSLFGGPSSSTASSTTPAPAKPLGLFGNATTSAPSSTPAQPTSMFSNLGAKPATTSAPAATATPGATTTGATPSLFAPKPAETTTGTAPSSSAPGASTSTGNAGANALGASTSTTLGASTAGPAPQLSRLKNKTMDEIITRWATDLSTYQKEFQNQAAKVASWDRLLVENGDKIQKLYTSTFEAERASAEVERQLTSVESQQDELTAWLDHYEREVNDMFAKQVGGGESLQGPDQERERTYKLAEKLTDRLDEMGKDLTSMIQEINAASASLTKTSKPDDPLSQIVRVLNGHLSQLQWIDQNAAALQAKVAAAQKAGQSIAQNGYGSAENDPADDFYRSFMGRR